MRRIGLYPGTFDPVTYGHIDIIRQARILADELVIGVARHSDKETIFSAEERRDILQESLAEAALENISVRIFDTLMVRFAQAIQADLVIRGLRAVSDFEYEFQMVGMNQIVHPETQTVFLMANVQHQAISSKLVKEIARLHGDISRFVPQAAMQRLQDIYAKENTS